MRLDPRSSIAGVALAITAGSAHAQASLTADLGLNSQYIWRGVTSTNRFVVQPELTLTLPVRGLTFAAGAWGNIEPVRYDGPRDISSLEGLPGPFITQSEAWGEIGGSIAKRVDAAFGVHGYFYPDVGDLADFRTTELYLTLGAEAFVSPTLSINYDIGPIRGAYVEAGLSRAVTGERRGALTLSVLAGYSAGQGEDPSGRDLAYFERDGLTHLDAATSATFTLGRMVIAPEAHVIVACDALAMVVAPDATRRTKLWFGTTLSWSTSRDGR
jgi:hypothetical protein